MTAAVASGVRFLGGKTLAPGLGAEIFRVPPHGVPLAVHLKFQLHKGGCFGVGVFTAEHGPLSHAAAGVVVEGVGDGVKEGGLACPGVPRDEVQATPAQLLQRESGLGGIGPKGRKGQFQRPHASSSPFQMDSMSCWQNAACSSLRGWLFCN